jgi:FlaG/FlaF family flagellin (archaellin)/TM2 domain-containing membrane protein YozV
MEDSENWFDRGVTLSEEGNYSEAITAFNKAITCNQSPADAWCNRGLVYAQMGKYRLALQSLDQTLALDPDHENAKKARAVILARMEKTKDTDSAPEVAPPPRRPPVTAPVVSQKPVPLQAKASIRSPILAVIFSFLFSGWGQWYNGERWKGLVFLAVTIFTGILNFVLSLLFSDNLVVSLVFMLLGLGIWIYGMYDAYTTAESINRGKTAFTRKSRLFWLPVILLVLMVIVTILLAAVIASFVFGMAGNVGNAGNVGMAGNIEHTRVVAATAQQTDAGHIKITYHGGPDADQVSHVVVVVTDSEGSVQTDIIGQEDSVKPLETGSSVTIFGRFDGKDHVVATAKFIDQTEQVIFDSYV